MAQCCKAKEFGGWCSDKETVYTDKTTDKSYCVFHAPKGEKGVSFNDVVFKRIDEIIEKQKEDPVLICDFSGTIFDCDIDFSKYQEGKPLRNFKIMNAQFNGGANFEGTQFNGNTTFWKTQFSGHNNFGNAEFNGRADFRDVKFKLGASFYGVKFSRLIDFSFAQINGMANFEGTQFNGNTTFSWTYFNGNTTFWRTQFGGNVHFGMTQFRGNVSFGMTQFKGNVDFREVQFKGNVSFREAQFIREIIFSKILTEDYIEFSKSKISGQLRFEDIPLFKASFIDVNLGNVDFIRCGWPKKQSTFLNLKLFEQFKRNVLYDEILIDSGKTSYGDVEKLYQQMKKKYKGNEPEVSNWHYGQREMFGKKNIFRHYFPFSFSNLYWAFSGYGERPMRAGIMLICFFIAVTFLSIFLELFPLMVGPLMVFQRFMVFHGN